MENNIYNNGTNTLGIGNPMPPRKCCMTSADFADDRNNGSADIYPIMPFNGFDGQSPRDLWSDDYKKIREDGLKMQKEIEKNCIDYTKPLPLLWFTE